MDSTNRNNNKTFAIGLIGGLGLAAALGAGFLLGGGRGNDPTTAAADPGAALRLYATAATGGAAAEPAGQAQFAVSPQHVNPSQPSGGDPAGDPTAVDTAIVPTDTPEVEEPDEPEITPTSTPGCNFCGAGDIAVAPTATPDPDPEPCPFCVDPVIGTLIDVTPPTISNVDTSFCFPILVISLDVDAPANVWFEYSYNGNTYESSHADAANDAYIPEDLGGFGWGVYFINNLEVHAVDLSGNHAIVDVAMPEPDLAC